MPLLAPFIARTLVRPLPFATQQTFREAALADAGTLIAEFDVAAGITDQNRFLTGAYPNLAGTPPQRAIGPYLDALAWVTGVATIQVYYCVDLGCSYHPIVPATVVPASTLTNIGGLRITGRFVKVVLTNTSGGPIAAEFGVYVRST